jgi:pimeloyl-ACP methyl ester carboxylesterase
MTPPLPGVVPFRIDVPQAELDELRRRINATRWPEPMAEDWSLGTAPGDFRRLLEHWGGAYDWRAAEARLNAIDQVQVTVPVTAPPPTQGRVDGAATRVHALRAGTPGATPLLLIHGWPDGVIRFEKALPLIAERFEIVVPSIPGYGFSEIPAQAFGPTAVADALAGLMVALGHEQFVVHGADIGSSIAQQLALRHPERVSALHLGEVPLRMLRTLSDADLNDAERGLLAQLDAWDVAEGAYSHLQRTKPQTLAASLNDSPAGLASWMLEKFHGWSDDHGDVFSRFSLDDLATNLTIYWVTQTAGSAARYYANTRLDSFDNSRVTAPTGGALFPKDITVAPRSTAERWFDVRRWTEMPTGGHFGPWEEPQAWAAELIAFADQVGA